MRRAEFVNGFCIYFNKFGRGFLRLQCVGREWKIDFRIVQNVDSAPGMEKSVEILRGIHKNENINKRKSVLFYKKGLVYLSGCCILYP